MRARKGGGAQGSFDLQMMGRCLTLAARAEGRTSPNPMVGAVLVRRGRVIAEAFHRGAGAPHAEATALRKAGSSARGATLYTNLEPCCHFGRTPPCVDAILAMGIRRLVVAHQDPYELVNGKGLAAVRRGGIRVKVGPLREEAMRLNERYLTFVTQGRPFVLVKAGMTLDGRIATSGGESRWITSRRSRSRARQLRASFDAVMVGGNTARVDDPSLTAGPSSRKQSGPGRQPIRVILDSHLSLPQGARLLRPGRSRPGGPVLIYTSRRPPKDRAELLARRGATVVPVPTSAPGRLDMRAVLHNLAQRGATSVMVEGGGELIWSMLEAELVDKVAFFVSPILVGGREAVPVVGGRGVRKLRDAFLLKELSVTRLGSDMLIEGYVSGRGV